ncbi:Sigma factor PP2C-like phosphatase [Aureococcus anophagefferens]|nr:Sigma factor PP2C-like phosphatase [Aureococcus anophagefferens]
MEDVAHVRTRIRVPERDTANAALLIVFDGHGGKRCAEWASELLPERLRKRADRERDASGSTVLACLFDGTDRLYVASLGDCRCVLATRDGYCNLTTDCRADRPDEVARVVAARGFVANRRVNGQIALRDGDDFLLIGCDGLYDVLTSEEAVDFARDQLRAGRPLDAAALNLVHHAIDDRDSRDNVSAQSRRHRAVNEADAAAGGPSALHGSSRVNASPYAPPAPQGEGRANSKSKIMDDDDLMDFLLDDANFD